MTAYAAFKKWKFQMPKDTSKKAIKPLAPKTASIKNAVIKPDEAPKSAALAAVPPKPPTPLTTPKAPVAPTAVVAAPKPAAPTPKPVGAVFVLHAPAARQVSICGEFNAWKPGAAPLHRRRDGAWETTLALRPGHYQYKFVVDGAWIHDPGAKRNVYNEHGTFNSVIEVRA